MRPDLRVVSITRDIDGATQADGVGELELIRGFIANQAMRGLSPATIKRRGWTLTTFVDSLTTRRMVDATTTDVERFISSRPSPATRRALLCDLRAFYRWANSRDLCNFDPTHPVESPKVPKRLPTPLTHDELARAWQAAGTEMRVIIALGASAGLRVSEMAALDAADINLESRTLTVRNGKGGKDRRIPMSHHLVTMFTHQGPGPVLRASSGESVSAKVRAHFKMLSINKRAHDLRATFATEAARVSGGNLLLVAQLLGHESMETTQRYVALPPVGWDVVNRLYLELAA